MSNSLASLTSVEWTQGKLDEKQTLADIYTSLSTIVAGKYTDVLDGGKKYWVDWDGNGTNLDLSGLMLSGIGTAELHIHYYGLTDLTPTSASPTVLFPNTDHGSTQNWLWVESSTYDTVDLPSTIHKSESGSVGGGDGHFICFAIRTDKAGNIIINKAYDYFLPQPSTEA